METITTNRFICRADKRIYFNWDEGLFFVWSDDLVDHKAKGYIVDGIWKESILQLQFEYAVVNKDVFPMQVHFIRKLDRSDWTPYVRPGLWHVFGWPCGLPTRTF